MNRWWRLFLKLSLTLLVAVGLGLVYLNAHLSRQFESLSWAVGAKIYARPLELFQGASFTIDQTRFELDLLNYQVVEGRPGRGQYQIGVQSLWIGMRGHEYPDGNESDRLVRVDFENGRVSRITDQYGKSVDIIRFEPLVIAQLSGAHADREIIRLSDLPPGFVDMLIAVEDRAFYDHAGISITGIMRALVNNVLAGRFAQGGSTLTQQLVKNLYLTRERTLTRKGLEAIYAILLDAGFSKDRILEAYVNEVFLGQWGNRAIHGFGTAAQFYFGRPIYELSVAQQALLIGLIKGPSAFNPRRFPERALERRNLILSLASGQGTNDYTSKQLTAAGLKIYTALDPQVHRGLIEGRKNMLFRLKDIGLDPSGEVQMGALVVDIPTGEIQAVLAGRNNQVGFHRVLDARRQIGSLVKPFVVAAAIEEDPRLHAGTLVRDEAVSIRDEKGSVWAPKNYDKTEQGVVRLETVIASSINQATVHLALGLGLDSILDRLAEYGIPVGPTKPPATVLGVSEMSPYQVATRYQGLLNQGYLTPLKAVRTVVDDSGRTLTRRPFQSTRLMTARAAVQVDHMMRVGAKVGTGRAFGNRYSEVMTSKTGTTDDGRDAWFVGADGRRLGVAWIGFDDNRKAGLIGSVAALPVISDAFQYVQRTNRAGTLPEGLRYSWLDESGQIVDQSCKGAEKRPLPIEYRQAMPGECGGNGFGSPKGNWLNNWFGG
ncbi:MAG: hypothetical protein EBW40_05035 [Gammaproteobacteria bacterium]|nr:hypothetical protein [Gammaproteobacteria bacterium]